MRLSSSVVVNRRSISSRFPGRASQALSLSGESNGISPPMSCSVSWQREHFLSIREWAARAWSGLGNLSNTTCGWGDETPGRQHAPASVLGSGFDSPREARLNCFSLSQTSARLSRFDELNIFKIGSALESSRANYEALHFERV